MRAPKTFNFFQKIRRSSQFNFLTSLYGGLGRRFFFIFTLFLFLPIVGIILSYRIKDEQEQRYEQQITDTGRLLRGYLQPYGERDNEALSAIFKAYVRRVLPDIELNIQVQYLDENACVLYDSKDAGRLNHCYADRQEIGLAFSAQNENLVYTKTRVQPVESPENKDDAQESTYYECALPLIRNGRTFGVIYISASTVSVMEKLWDLRDNLILLIFAGFIILIINLLFLSWTIIRPIQILTRNARYISEGDLEKVTFPRAVNRQDEMGALQVAFMDMVKKLQLKMSFFSTLAGNLSHEFKTPLTAIGGTSELLLSEEMDKLTREKFLKSIHLESARLNRLVDDTLAFARLERDLSNMKFSDIPANSLAKEVIDNFQPVIAPRQVSLEFVPANDEIYIRGNPDKIKQALINLLTNAYKYTEEKIGKISLEVSSQQDQQNRQKWVVISIIDNGTGIPEKILKKVFDRFFTTEKNPGKMRSSGLGLSIVQEIMMAHNGDVEVESEVGQGTVFRLFFRQSEI